MAPAARGRRSPPQAGGRVFAAAATALCLLAVAPVTRAADAPASSPGAGPPTPGGAATAAPGAGPAPSATGASASGTPHSPDAPATLPPPVAPPPLAVPSGPTLPVVIPTADATPAPSDHDAVVGRWGIEARRFTSARFPLALRADRGCPTAAARPCTVEMGALSVRHWRTRNLAWSGGLALAVGGGREGTRALDTYVGGGPIVGLTLLLGNWKHLAIGASPELSVVVFKPGGETTQSTTLVDLRASLEGELHFGFVGVPALSIGLASGLVFHYESAPTFRVWSVGFGGASSVWGALTNLFIRYYL